MKAAALLLAAFVWQAVPGGEPPVVERNGLRYERAITVPADAREACAVLDAAIFPHAAPSLRDMRILPAEAGATGAAREIPFAVTMSEAGSDETEPARLENLRSGAVHSVAFDLEMPPRVYSSVTLDLDPAMRNFVATATVSGSDFPDGAKSKALGSFTLFDLSSQHLSRDTTLPLEESQFHYLHVALSVVSAPGNGAADEFSPAMVRGAEVPPSREAQTLYTTVAETAAITMVGRDSHAQFAIPRRVPVERVSLVLTPEFKGNFSRKVRVTAIADATARDGDADEDGRAPLPEVVTGNIQRVDETVVGRKIRSEQLGVAAILGANLQHAAKVDVAIENGGEQPLPIAAVRLEMRQREVCFDAAAGAGSELALYYGDAKLPAPMYGYERMFVTSRKAAVAELGPEQVNPAFTSTPAGETPLIEHRPEMLWIVLIAVACAIAMVGLRARSA